MSTTNTRGKAAAPAPASQTENDDDEADGFDALPQREFATLALALISAQRLIAGGVRKTGQAKIETRAGGEYGYKFAKGEDMIAGCREVLLACGLLWSLERYEIVDEQGSDLPIFVPTFTLEHPSSGATIENEREDDEVAAWIVSLPDTDDRRLRELVRRPRPRRFTFPIPISMAGAADKALAGARTYASSYALRDVLLVPRPDENEPDKRRSDDGVGSWRTGGKTSGAKTQAPAEPERRKTAAEIAYDNMNAAWRDYQRTARAHGTEPSFATVYRQALGKDWPGQASKVSGPDMAKAAAEIKRLGTLLEESNGASGPGEHESEREGDPGELFSGEASDGGNP